MAKTSNAVTSDSTAVPDRPQAPPLPDPPPLEPVPEGPRPKRDSRLQRAGFEAGGLIETRAQEPAGAQASPNAPAATSPAQTQSRPLSRPAAANRPSSTCRRSKGPRTSRCPNLRNTEDVPKSRPCPAPPKTSLRLRRDRTIRDRRRNPRLCPRRPLQTGSFRVTTIWPRSGRKMDIQTLPEQADGTRVIIIRGGVNIVTQTPNTRNRRHRVRERRDLETPRPQERGATPGAQWRVDRQSQSAHGGLPRRQRDPPPGRDQVRGQGRPADLPRQAGLLRFRDRPCSSRSRPRSTCSRRASSRR